MSREEIDFDQNIEMLVMMTIEGTLHAIIMFREAVAIIVTVDNCRRGSASDSVTVSVVGCTLSNISSELLCT